MKHNLAYYFVIAFPFIMGLIAGIFATKSYYFSGNKPSCPMLGLAIVAVLVTIFYGALI